MRTTTIGMIFLVASLQPAVSVAQDSPTCDATIGECSVLDYQELPHEVTQTELLIEGLGPDGKTLTTLGYSWGRSMQVAWQRGQGECSAATACRNGAKIRCERSGATSCSKRGWWVACGSYDDNGDLEATIETCKGKSDWPSEPPPDPTPPPGDNDEEKPPGGGGEEGGDPAEEEGGGGRGDVFHCDMDLTDPVLGHLVFCIEYDSDRIGRVPSPAVIDQSAAICRQAGGAWDTGPCRDGWEKFCARPTGVAHAYYQFVEGAPESQCSSWRGELTVP